MGAALGSGWDQRQVLAKGRADGEVGPPMVGWGQVKGAKRAWSRSGRDRVKVKSKITTVADCSRRPVHPWEVGEGPMRSHGHGDG
jgi:hypothetical protein